jgi:hypothetical protein
MHEIKLGDVTVTRVEETHGPIMPTGAFFPTMPDDSWQEHRDLLVPDHLGADDDMVHIALQTWLLRSEGRTILIDTGIGNDKNRPAVEPWHRQQLDAAGQPWRSSGVPSRTPSSSGALSAATDRSATGASPGISGRRGAATTPQDPAGT